MSILPALLVIIGSALLILLVYGPPYLNYDASYSLVWAHDIAHGFTPDYNGFIAPTPHPLQTFVSYPRAAAGIATDRIARVDRACSRSAESSGSSTCSAGALQPPGRCARGDRHPDAPGLREERRCGLPGHPVRAVRLLGAAARDPASRGAAGRCSCCSRSRDCCAPRRGCSRASTGSTSSRRARWSERIGLARSSAAAPVLWAISDCAIAGDFLHSFHGTKDLAAQLDRPRSTISRRIWTAKFFGFTLREPLIIGVPIGCVFTASYNARKQAMILLGVATLMTWRLHLEHDRRPAADRALRADADGAAGDRLRGRSLRLAQSRPGRSAAQDMWKWIGVFSLMLSIVYIPWHIKADQGHASARSTTTSRSRRTCARSRTPAVPEVLPRLRPDLDDRPSPGAGLPIRARRPAGVVQSTPDTTHPLANLALYPASRLIAQKFYSAIPDRRAPQQAGGPPYVSVYKTWAWQLYASPDLRRGG